ncbi:ankyrin repeat domain-containing protein [Sphingobacterium composti Ten et al. 2007 non Yoo et al. 2007]|uniref:ankyrin repeat domain-containing protein n=1 Tax=Sphingobacterium composti TaxID=363260 RepID=UPI0013568924|nr:ankyrin repeat domain-containing protein [Sphingobacterium composti Ten et al. 2007 non Yoo et al. 2007]
MILHKYFSILISLLFAFQSCDAQENTDTSIQMDKQEIIKAVKSNDTTKIVDAINQGLDVNITDSEGRSLLLFATIHSLNDMAKFLVSNGADVNQQAQNLDSPFLYAGATGQTELLKIFLANGARFDIFNRYHGTALIPACERGHIEGVKLLANTKNFPINHVNRLGWTGLMEAVILGDGSYKFQKIVQILKDAGADMHIPDHDGVTPLQHAERRGFKEIVAIIKN